MISAHVTIRSTRCILAGLGFYFGGFSLCLIINVTLHTITLCIGLSLRSGTKLTTR